jgi:cysteine-rich repeat protein
LKHAALLFVGLFVGLVVVAAGCDGGISLDYKDYIPHPEICVNGVDDDGNGLIDCDDPACFADKACQRPKGHGLVEGEGEGEGGEGEGFAGEGEGEGAVCGDGVKEAGEVCDGFDFGGQDCTTQGFEDGFLQCKSDCTGFDTSNCFGVCGDDILDPAEQCDGADLNGETCADFTSPFGGTGALACTSTCTFDTSACKAPVCGDGVRNNGEACDASDFGGETCVNFTGGIGTLSCSADCTTVDSSQCQQPFCGDGLRNGGEQCEGTDLGANTCITVGLGLGTLGCTSSCTFDETQCQPVVCGDGVISQSESCDGNNLQGLTCQSFTGGVGTLSCNPTTCQFDTSQCQQPFCGDGLVNAAGEVCDGANLDSQSCQSLGFQSGNLACAANCTFDTSACVPFVCGNGVREGNEVCDRADLGGQTCQSENFINGTLACAADCKSFDTSGCNGCGNGILNPGEQCDDGNTTPGDFCSPTCQLEIAPTPESEPNDNGGPRLGGSGTQGNNFSSTVFNGPFTSDTIITGSLEPAGDEDVFAIQNPTAAAITVDARVFTPALALCNNDTVLTVRDAAANILAQNDDSFGLCSNVSFTIAANTTVFLQLTEFGDDADIPAYQLIVDFP